MLDKSTVRILYAITHYLQKEVNLDNSNWWYRFKIALIQWYKLVFVAKSGDLLISARMRGLCMFLNPHKSYYINTKCLK